MDGNTYLVILMIFRGELIQAIEKIVNFPLNSFIIISVTSAQFANHFIPTLNFLTEVLHSYSLLCSVIVLLLSHLPSKLKFSFLFCSETNKNLLSSIDIFFLLINATLEITNLTTEFNVISRSFKKILIRCS